MAHEVLEELKPTLLSETYDAKAEKSPDRIIREKINDLRHKAQIVMNDEPHYEIVGLSAQNVQKPILDAADALESAVILYQGFEKRKSAEQMVMDEYGDSLERTRNEILSRLVYISKLPGHGDIKDNVEMISQNSDIKDTILDLGSCYEVGLRKKDALAATNFTEEKLEYVGEVFRKVSKAYPVVNASEQSEREAMLLRNRAYWHAVEMERVLREDILPMVFWDDSSFKSRYASQAR